MRKNRKNFTVSILALCLSLLFCNCTYSSNVLVSKENLYPSYIKTPQDIEDWLVAEGFIYKSDKTRKDEWKTPEQTIKDKAGDCEDYAILSAVILRDLGYEKVMVIAIFGKNLAHGICWFKEKDGTWSIFSTSVDGAKFYYPLGFENPFVFLYSYFPEWTYFAICTDQGYNIKTYYRKDIEEGRKK